MRESLSTDHSAARPGFMADAGTYVGEPVLDFVRAPQMVQTMSDTGASKKDLPAAQIFVRGMFGGALLAFGTSLAFLAIAQGVPPIVAALLFPTGFIVINLLGVDLITGYFALVPLAWIHGRMTFGELLRAWFWVWLGNLAGGVLYAGMLWAGLTMTGRAPDATGLAAVATKIGLLKTVHYEQFGTAGAFAAFIKAMLCNWMVTLGVVLPMTSRSVIGKAVATFVPIYMFFAMGYEHMVVNMFIIPIAMFFGAPISMSDFWVGNELPVTIGNFAGGFLFTGAALGWLFHTRRTTEEPIAPLGRPATV
ncbi:MAG TPA: formate/nitrite transporter family protein [Candidatus Limnocylindria bacterium]|jgi:formate/nitrite transporter|nr:formate/nitrite transporter family protein [Candidatus Limnocylindria bacterium]